LREQRKLKNENGFEVYNGRWEESRLSGFRWMGWKRVILNNLAHLTSTNTS
jgi:hypothetical protein